MTMKNQVAIYDSRWSRECRRNRPKGQDPRLQRPPTTYVLIGQAKTESSGFRLGPDRDANFFGSSNG